MKSSTARFAGIIALSLCLGHGGFAAPAAPSPSAKAPTKPKAATPKLAPNVVAQVNGRNITRDDVLGLFDMLHGRPVVGEIIKDTVIGDEARRLKVTVSDAELAKAVQGFKDSIVQRQMQQGQPTTYEAFAAQQGISADILRWTVYRQTLQHDTFVRSLEAQIPTISDQIKVAHILIATIPLGGATDTKEPTAAEQAAKDAEAKTKIDGILADINAKKISFEDAAGKYSDDPSNKSQGGVLPFAPKHTFDPAFEDAAWSIKKKGDVVGPIKSKFGWHLIKLIARGSDATAAEKKAYHDDQMAMINKQASDSQAQQYWLNDLVTKAHVTVNPTPSLVPNPKLPVSVSSKKTAAR